MVAVALLVVEVVGVDHLAARQCDRVLVGDPAHADRGVDVEVERLERGEQQLGLPAGEAHHLRQRAERQQRLMAVAVLVCDSQRSLLDLDRRVHQTQHVDLERDDAPPVVLVARARAPEDPSSRRDAERRSRA